MEAHEIQALTGDFPPIFVSRPNFVISQLQNEHTNLRTGKEALRNFSLLYAGQMRLCEGQKDLTKFRREFGEASMPMWEEARSFSPCGRGGEVTAWQKRRVADAGFALCIVFSRFCHHSSPPIRL
jgi:hypothetical protein